MSEKKPFVTYRDLKSELPAIASYDYQAKLTEVLDHSDSEIDQGWINQVVLWKVNRYAEIDDDTLRKLQELKDDYKNKNGNGNAKPDEKLIKALLKVKGVQIAMASTILRFCNPDVYQIIDQRVYRFIYGLPNPENQIDPIVTVVQYKTGQKSKKGIDRAVSQYLEYLTKLREVCKLHNVSFNVADRIWYLADKYHNEKEYPLKGYGNK